MPPRKCCCDDVCLYGCCFPYDYLEPPAVPEGQEGNYAQILQWEIDAPNCPEIDGLVGQFSPETTGPHDPLTECGFCLCYNNEDGALDPITGTAKREVFDPPPSCEGTPCLIELCLGLQCNRQEPPDTPEKCCRQFRLIVIVKLADISGGDPVDTNSQCFEGEGIEGNPNFPGCNGPGDDVDSKELTPTTCQCEDPELMQEFQLIFDLSDLSFTCGEIVGGLCDGEPNCCVPINCSFAGATVTVTRL